MFYQLISGLAIYASRINEIARVKPDVLRELHGEPLTRFRQFCGIGNIPKLGPPPSAEEIRRKACVDDYNFPAEATMPLGLLPPQVRDWHIRNLQDWAANNNLDSDWVIECAYETLQAWAFTPGKGDEDTLKPRWSLSSYGGRLPLTQPSPAGMPEYTPGFDTRPSYLREVRALAVKAIESQPILSNSAPSQRTGLLDSILEKAERYCADVEAAHEKAAWVRQEELREQGKHMTWAVQFQILKMDFSEIAKSENNEVSTVSRAVNKILELIGSSRRPETGPGRRKGSKKSPILSGLGK
jgi:hypothetical protein